MTRVAVLDDYQHVASDMADWGRLGAEIVFFADHLSDEAALAERLRDFDVVVLMRERTPFRASLMDRLPALRLIVTAGMRNAAIDLAAAGDKGIVVSGTEGLSLATADLTWALILALARHVVTEDHATRAGRWQTTLGIDLADKTLGVLGLGNLGTRVAQIGRAFGMDVIAWSANLTSERAGALGATRVEKEELFARSDVVTIHLLLSRRTRGLVGAAELALMKPTAYLINTSRGPIVDERALLEALRSGAIGGAGLDVYDQEPLPAGHPLFSAPNTVMTPHIGFVTEQTYRAWFAGAVEAIAAFVAGAPVRVLNDP